MKSAAQDRSFLFTPLLLLVVCILSFGLLIPWLGFYWDDWAFAWISQVLGPAGLTRYFATNRPFWGMIFQVTTPLLGHIPWHYQVFALGMHWVAALCVWWMLRLIWPRQPRAAVWVSLLFAVYPGFDQQSISITYGHYFIVMAAWLGSLGCTLQALRSPNRRWLFTMLALLTSLINLLAMEYFFLLEVMRPLFIWVVLAERSPGWKERLRRTLQVWLPNLLLFLGVGIWRAFFFRFQTQNYQTVILDQLKSQPFTAGFNLLVTILQDLFKTSFQAWAKVFTLPDMTILGGRSVGVYAGLVMASVVILVFWLHRSRQAEGQEKGWGLYAVLLGLAGMLAAGWPFWLTGLPVGLVPPNSRFTLPFMLGASLLLAGLLEAIPLRYWIKIGMLSIAVSLAVGFHFQTASMFRRDWDTLTRLFWQMTWRIPGLKEGTTLLANDLPIKFSSDNSLVSPLNWIYAPQNNTPRMSYFLYYPSLRYGTGLNELKKDQPIEQYYLAADFYGNTSQVVAFVYQPPGCLRVLDAQLDPFNNMLPPLMRQAAALSDESLIIIEPVNRPMQPPQDIFGVEPPHGWCYFLNRAELARQKGDWLSVVELGEQALKLDDTPNDPMERLVFIEGYAHTGNWEQALQLTRITKEITPMMQSVLCALWQRIDGSTSTALQKTSALQGLQAELNCSP